jgi:hypothetical protein
MEALRILKRRLSDVEYRAMLTDETDCLARRLTGASQSLLCPRAQIITLMLDPPPSTLPMS